MAGIQGASAYYKDGTNVINESNRLNINIDEEVAYLNVDKSSALALMQKMKKSSVDRMKHLWLTQERKKDFVTLEAVGGAWDAGAANSGTFEVAETDAFLFAEGDVITMPEVSTTQNFYIKSVNQETGQISAITVPVAGTSPTIDLSAAGAETADVFLMSNSFESGTGVGTIKSEQPTEDYNYVQIFQTPIGITTTGNALNYRGKAEWDKMKYEAAVDHAFKIEKQCFFGQRGYKNQGLMEGVYEQWFMGGFMEYFTENNVDASGALTRQELDSWLIDFTKYAKLPVVMCGELIFEALTTWSETKLQVTSNETTLGMSVGKVLTPYGATVGFIPHRELLTGTTFGGMAFGIDMGDVEYRYLQGLDTHIDVDLQAKGSKTKVDEIRTWASMKVGNPKKHGLLYGATSIT